MKLSDGLVPQIFKAQCDSAIQTLEQDNENIQILQKHLKNFIEDDELVSEAYDALKRQISDYLTVTSAMITANECDIEDLQTLKGAVGDEELDGYAILTGKNDAWSDMDVFSSKADSYRRQAENIVGLASTKVWYDEVAVFYEALAGIAERKYERYSELEQRYDEMEAATRNLFSRSSSLRNFAKQGIASIRGAFQDGTYHMDMSASWRSELDLEFEKNVLINYLRTEGYSEAEQKEIVEFIIKERPDMVRNLYITNCNDTASSDTIFKQIMSYYNQHKNDKKLDYAEEILDSYLKAYGYTNSVEREFIIDMIREEYPKSLLNLYYTNNYSSASNNAVAETAINYYESNKEEIKLDEILNQLRKEVNSSNEIFCEDAYEYFDYMQKLHYICWADYDYLMGNFKYISKEEFENIEGYLSERIELVDKLEAEGWKRYEITCALAIETALLDAGYDKEFISGVIGNMKGEDVCGGFENANYGQNEPPEYLAHVIEHVDYKEIYSNRNITEFDLMQVYNDLVCKKEECQSENHAFGLGAFQWTYGRTEEVLKLYFKEAGYDVESDEFKKKLQDYQNNKESMNYEGIFITEEQVQKAEMEFLVLELNSASYSDIYDNYKNEKNNDMYMANAEGINNNVNIATKIIKEEYEINFDSSLEKRQDAANEWYVVRYKNIEQ